MVRSQVATKGAVILSKKVWNPNFVNLFLYSFLMRSGRYHQKHFIIVATTSLIAMFVTGRLIGSGRYDQRCGFAIVLVFPTDISTGKL